MSYSYLFCFKSLLYMAYKIVKFHFFLKEKIDKGGKCEQKRGKNARDELMYIYYTDKILIELVLFYKCSIIEINFLFYKQFFFINLI